MNTIFKYLIALIILCAIVASTSSNAFACGEHAVFVYEITKTENGQYWGTGVYDDTNIYFIQENIITADTFKVSDVVLAYFDPENITDGLIGIERAIPVGF